MPGQTERDIETLSVQLKAEHATVAKRRVDGDLVRVTTSTRQIDHLVDEELTHERVEVERVPIGRIIQSVPPVREEGDMTIMPVVEEVVVVERRLVLKEEVRIRRFQATSRHQERVMLRTQQAEITRTEAGHRTTGEPVRLSGNESTMKSKEQAHE